MTKKALKLYHGTHLLRRQHKRHVIHGMSPGEPLQVLELVLFKIMIQAFYVNLGCKPGLKSYPKILELLDVWGQKISRKMPCAYFPNGVTGVTKLVGHKMNGVILVLLILCKMKDGRKMLLTSKYILENIIFMA
jgi:hypothetical protein